MAPASPVNPVGNSNSGKHHPLPQPCQQRSPSSPGRDPAISNRSSISRSLNASQIGRQTTHAVPLLFPSSSSCSGWSRDDRQGPCCGCGMAAKATQGREAQQMCPSQSMPAAEGS